MKKHLVTSPTPTYNLTFEDLYEEISSDWQEKARKLRVRRMRAMQHSLKEKPLRNTISHIHRAKY